MPWLFLLFVVVPATELYLLIQLGELIGGIQTLGIVIATGMLGSYMAKSQGMAVWKALNNKLATSAIPGDELTDGAIILVSGTLLITPGVLTDIVGFLGLIPWTRTLYRRAAKHFLKGRTGIIMNVGGFGQSGGFSRTGGFSQSSGVGQTGGFNQSGDLGQSGGLGQSGEMNQPSGFKQSEQSNEMPPGSHRKPGTNDSSNMPGSKPSPKIEVSGKAKPRPSQ